MAEAVGLAASIATLTSIIRGTLEIARHGPHIPREIEQVSRQLEQISIQLDILHDIQEYTVLCLPPRSRIFDNLCISLDRNIEEFTSIQDSLRKLAGKSKGAKGQICWLLVGRDEALHQSRRLQEMRVALNLTLSLLSTALHLLQFVSTDKVETLSKDNFIMGLNSMKGNLNHSQVASNNAGGTRTADASNTNRYFYVPFWPEQCRTATISGATYYVPFLGSTVTSFLKIKSTASRYELALKLSLPFSRALIMRALLSSRNWLNLNIQGSLKVSRIVDEDCPFMVACKNGESQAINRLLLEGSASVEDRTIRNKSALQLAIHSRDYDAVKTLLDRGADVNAMFGQLQTSPLASAVLSRNANVVRLLLSRGADCYHITNIGWSPVFYLWWGTENQFDFVCQAETILRILASCSDFPYTYSGVIDTLGFAAIHMAVMRGTINQMRFLLDLDPTLAQVKGFLDWTAIHVAVSEGRLDMLEFLLPFYDQSHILTTKDGRGWTLLHTSAAEGESDVTRHLLKLGADWQCLSTPSMEEVPDVLRGRCCTPLEAATAESFTRRLAYLKDVKSVLGEGYLSDEELEEVSEEWIDTVSYMV